MKTGIQQSCETVSVRLWEKSIGSILNPLVGKFSEDTRRNGKGAKTGVPHDWRSFYLSQYDWLKGSHMAKVVWLPNETHSSCEFVAPNTRYWHRPYSLRNNFRVLTLVCVATYLRIIRKNVIWTLFTEEFKNFRSYFVRDTYFYNDLLSLIFVAVELCHWSQFSLLLQNIHFCACINALGYMHLGYVLRSVNSQRKIFRLYSHSSRYRIIHWVT